MPLWALYLAFYESIVPDITIRGECWDASRALLRHSDVTKTLFTECRDVTNLQVTVRAYTVFARCMSTTSVALTQLTRCMSTTSAALTQLCRERT
eukprot:COSAG01_NODE_2510_length_7546_cov_498.494427_7_plen_95_part_00